MNHARIEQIGTPDELYFRPRSLFASDFIGESNVFPAVVRSFADGHLQVSGPGASALRLRSERAQLAGETVTLMVRPERIRLAAAEGSDGCAAEAPNRIPGRIEEIAFLGDTVRYYVRIDADYVFSAKELTAGTVARAQVGDAVSLVFDKDSVIALPPTSAATPAATSAASSP